MFCSVSYVPLAKILNLVSDEGIAGEKKHEESSLGLISAGFGGGAHLAFAQKGESYPSSGGYRVSAEDEARIDATLQRRGEIQLRRMGVSPQTARDGIWATMHKPYSPCARAIRRLTAEGDMQDMRPDLPDTGYNEGLIIHIEQSGLCNRDRVNKSKPPPETPLQKREREQLNNHFGYVSPGFKITD